MATKKFGVNNHEAYEACDCDLVGAADCSSCRVYQQSVVPRGGVANLRASLAFQRSRGA